MKEESLGGDVEIAQFIVVQDIFKEFFEEWVPIEAYYNLKSQLDKMGI